ncbi:TIGR01906 family membrane protein [Candidatus Woesearchaeota archaeon]|nr:TIGR01906 family membrane protein [Candidatus Woesearchaeota archaeon]
MKRKNLIINSIIFLLILCIIILVFLTSFNLNAFNESFYKKEFEKYRIYETFPDKDIERINSGLLSYLKGKESDFNKELFNQKEIEHLKDVKLLIQKINLTYCSISIVSVTSVLALFLLDKKRFLKNLSIAIFAGGLASVLCVIAVLLLIKMNFSSVFTVFHHIFFPQGGWLFSSSDNIIKLYPSGLFYDAAKRIFTSAFLYGNILILVGVVGLYQKKILKRQQK